MKDQCLSDSATRRRPGCGVAVRPRVVAHDLDIILAGFAADLGTHGYTDTGVRRRVHVAEHFARWIEREGAALPRWSREEAARFLRSHLSHCRCPEPAPKDRGHCRSALGRFLRYLEAQRLIPPTLPEPPPRTAVDRLLAAYDRHLDKVCGLSLGTRQNRYRGARRFLKWRFGDRPVQLRRLQSKDVSDYVLERARQLGSTGIHPLCVDLRSFLRFLEFSRRHRQGLANRVPQPPPGAVPSLPKLLQPQEHRAFLSSFPRATPQGRRDYAIALCLSELALRGEEVASLTLEDLDWRALTVRLARTKQRRQRLVPLPDRVARAILDYLKRGRPSTPSRALFVHLRVPRGRPVAAHYIRRLVRAAFARCAIQVTGTHVLRHTWATWAHRRGASLKLIADVLGHRSLQASAGYAHVNTEELRRVALPWPRSKR